jgi:hypothetical protein
VHASRVRSLQALLILCGIAAVLVFGIWVRMSVSPTADRPIPSPPTLANGAVVGCMDRYQNAGAMGPLENGKYLHYLCQNGKLTSWWVDQNAGDEMAAPG